MAKVVEVFLSHCLSLGIAHVGSGEGVIDNLQGLPVTLCFKKFIHNFFGRVIAVSHDPSMETNEPDFFQHDLDLTS